MKLGRQGSLNVEGRGSTIVFISNPTEVNTADGKKPFKGEVIVQPHSVKLIWEVLEGNRDNVIIRSGQNMLIVKNQFDKSRVRIRFANSESESSYIVFGGALSRFKDAFLNAVRNAGVVSLRNKDFSAIRVGNQVILRNGTKEYYVDEEEAKKLKEFILRNFLLKQPVKMEGKIGIDEEKNLTYKGLTIPYDNIKDLYLFIL